MLRRIITDPLTGQAEVDEFVKDLITYCKFEHKLKDEPGWHRTIDEEGTLTVTTPTGRSYPSKPEPLYEPRPLPKNDHDDTAPPF